MILEDKVKTSPKKFAKIINNHFINNVKKIQKGFEEERNDLIEYHRKLIIKPDNTFKLKEIIIK